jgi:hypothetical protein
VILLALIALKLAAVINWSWWWVLAPLWFSIAQPALAAGFLLTMYGRHLWLSWLWRRRLARHGDRRLVTGTELCAGSQASNQGAHDSDIGNVCSATALACPAIGQDKCSVRTLHVRASVSRESVARPGPVMSARRNWRRLLGTILCCTGQEGRAGEGAECP